jgi:broad specificity phosphatase PhoE
VSGSALHPDTSLHFTVPRDLPVAEGPAQVCIARHGETDWNTAGILQGWMDVEINDEGRRQAFEMAAALAGAGFSSICSSPLRRAAETAEIIARELGLPPPELLEGLKERNFGVIQGIPKAELAELNPVILQQILKRNPACDFEQGESMDEFADRILAGLTSIAGPRRRQAGAGHHARLGDGCDHPPHSPPAAQRDPQHEAQERRVLVADRDIRVDSCPLILAG